MNKEWKFRIINLSCPPIHNNTSNWIKIKLLCDTNLIIFFNELFFSTSIVFQHCFSTNKAFSDREFRYIFNINSFLQPNHKKRSEKKKKISIVVLQASFSFFFFYPFEFIPFFFRIKKYRMKNWSFTNIRTEIWIEIFLACFVSEIFRRNCKKLNDKRSQKKINLVIKIKIINSPIVVITVRE